MCRYNTHICVCRISTYRKPLLPAINRTPAVGQLFRTHTRAQSHLQLCTAQHQGGLWGARLHLAELEAPTQVPLSGDTAVAVTPPLNRGCSAPGQHPLPRSVRTATAAWHKGKPELNRTGTASFFHGKAQGGTFYSRPLMQTPPLIFLKPGSSCCHFHAAF